MATVLQVDKETGENGFSVFSFHSTGLSVAPEISFYENTGAYKSHEEGILEDSKANGGHLLINDKNKYRSMLIRAYSFIWIIGGFAFIIYIGHLLMKTSSF